LQQYRLVCAVGPLFWVAAAVLWQLAGCIVPPPEVVEPENRPPWLDWTLTTPQEDELTWDRSTESHKEFSIEGAVFDPEGDRIEILWYWVGTNELPESEYGTETMLLENLCQNNNSFATAISGEFITVEVVVSDHKLKWLGNAGEEGPVDTGVDDSGNPRPLIKRIWVVKLLGECNQ